MLKSACLVIVLLCPLVGAARTPRGIEFGAAFDPPQNEVTLPSENVVLKSPDESLVFTFKLTPAGPAYRVDYKGTNLVEDSPLDLVFRGAPGLADNFTRLGPVFREGTEAYELVVGKTRTVRSHYREALIPLKERGGAERRINLVIRAFNDGLAFRYEFPPQKNWDAYTLVDERSTFRLSRNPQVRTLFLPNFTSSHEGRYSTLPLSQVKDDVLMDVPTLFEFPGRIYLAITEAALRDYAGMYLVKRGGVLTSQLSPLPGQTEIKVKAVLPHRTP